MNRTQMDYEYLDMETDKLFDFIKQFVPDPTVHLQTKGMIREALIRGARHQLIVTEYELIGRHEIPGIKECPREG